MRLKLAAIVILASAALFVLIERLAGPPAEPVPAKLPHIVRRPPHVARSFDSAETFINPTSEVRQLHAQGITGRHIGVAIIDSFLLTEHREYSDRLRWYDEIDARPGDPASWHGTAVASLAVGRTVGVASEADLYFVGLGINGVGQAPGNLSVGDPRGVQSGQRQAVAIRRILELNRRLEPDRKIRVISISLAWGPAQIKETAAAVEEARRAGIFVAAPDLGTAPYGPVRIAGASGADAYIDARASGSWSVAYWAGRYALACQQDPSMTPERFRSTVLSNYTH